MANNEKESPAATDAAIAVSMAFDGGSSSSGLLLTLELWRRDPVSADTVLGGARFDDGLVG